MNLKPGILRPMEPEDEGFFHDPRKDVPHTYIGNGCAYFDHSYRRGTFSAFGGLWWLKAWVTAYIYLDGDEEDGYQLYLDLDCDPPHIDHFVSYIMDMGGSLDLISWDGRYHRGEEETEAFLIEQGIAPGQRFLMELNFTTSRDYWGEYDETLDGRIMDIEPWTTSQVLEAWEEHFKTMRTKIPIIGGSRAEARRS